MEEEELERNEEQRRINDLLQMEADMVVTYDSNEELIKEYENHEEIYGQDPDAPFDYENYKSLLAEEVQFFVDAYNKNLPSTFRKDYMKMIRQ